DPATAMKFLIPLYELSRTPVLAGFYQSINQFVQIAQVTLGNSRFCPLERQRLQLYAQSIEFAYLLRCKFRNVSSDIRDAPDKALFLKRNQRFPHGRRTDVHLLCELALYDDVAG